LQLIGINIILEIYGNISSRVRDKQEQKTTLTTALKHNNVCMYYIGGVLMLSAEKRIELLKILSHPVRIKILEDLVQGVKCVSDFEESLDISQPNVSQHLKLLRSHQVVDFFIDGRLKCYFLREPLIPDLLDLLKKEYEADIPAPACCPVTRKGTYPGERRR
jgi:ArsR family transcriptional regulator